MAGGLPELDYLEIEISEFCNLNCRGCCNFTNLAQKKQFYEWEEYVRDMTRVRELFSGIRKIRLMGGEPLLNPRVADYAEKARELFPRCDLRIVSNGLLLPTLDGGTLRRLKEAGVRFDVSNYPPTRARRDEIDRILTGAGISYDLGFPMNFFFRNIRETPAEDPGPAFRNCLFTRCHTMGHGRIAPCSYAYCIGRFNAHFGTAYPETDCFDLYSDVTGEQLIAAFSAPHAFCKCCGSGIVPLKWEGHVFAKDARPEDWLIRDTLLNTKLIPAAQRIIKPLAMALRTRIQDP